MLIRPHDGAPSNDAWRGFADAQGFGHLVAGGGPARNLPIVVPTQFALEDETVWLHLAKANPVFEAIEENPRVLLSIAGDWTYIPGQWKAVGDDDPRRGIPTTYYAAVQIEATATVSDDPTVLADVLRRQLAVTQPGDLASGQLVDPSEHQSQFRVIRALRLDIADVRAKFKYGGNLDQDRRQHIIGLLDERAGPGDGAAARHSRRFDDDRES